MRFTFFKRTFFIAAVFLATISIAVNAQNAIEGPTTVVTNVYYTYSFNAGGQINNPYWVINKGEKVFPETTHDWHEGNIYSVIVRWTSTGTNGTIILKDGDDEQKRLINIVITACEVVTSPTVDPNSAVRCGAGSLTLRGAAGENSMKWYDGPGPNASLLSTGLDYQTPSRSTGDTYYYTSYTSTGCESPRSSITTTINPAVDINDLGASDGKRCGTGPVTLTATVDNSNEHVIWYTQNTSGSYATGGNVGEGLSFTTPSISNTTTYYASLFNAATGCETSASSRVQVIANVNPFPSLPTGTNGSVCGSGQVTLNGAPGANGDKVKWYAGPSGGSELTPTPNPSYSPNISATTNFYISTYNSLTTCESTSRTIVTGVVNVLPGIPAAVNGYGCKLTPSTPVDVQLSGIPVSNASINWYTRENNEDHLITSASPATDYLAPQLSQQTTYYIASVDVTTGCESANKVAVIAHVNGLPSAPTASTDTPDWSCGPGRVWITAVPGGTAGSTINWFASTSSTQSLASGLQFQTPQLNNSIYYTARTYDPSTHCQSGTSIQVKADIRPQPNITATGNNQTICSGGNTSIQFDTDIPETLFSYTAIPTNVTGTTGGSGISNLTFSNPLQSANGTSPGNMKYTFWGIAAGCPGPTKEVTVYVNPVPVLSVTNNLTSLCSGQSSSISLSSNGVVGSLYSWSVNPHNVTGAGAVTNTSTSSIGQALMNTGTTAGDVTYTISLVAVNNGFSCPAQSTGTATIIVNPKPVASAVSTKTIFEGSTTDIPITSNVPNTNFSFNVTGTNNVSNAIGGSGATISQAITGADGVNPGDVTYTITPTASGCAGPVITSRVYVYPIPKITPSAQLVYMGSQATLSAQTFYDSYNWQTPSGLQAGTFSLTTGVAGNYLLTVTKNGVSANSSNFWLGSQFSGQNLNYIVSQTLQTGISDESLIAGLPVSSVSQSIQYFDELGRPIQSVVTQGSPQKKDIVQPIAYDAFGREVKKYLPYVDGDNGLYKNNSLKDPNSSASTSTLLYQSGKQYQFYQMGGVLAQDTVPYSQTVFEPSPLNRVIKQGAPGTAWQPNVGSIFSTADNTIKKRYQTNQANEVLLFTYDEVTGLVAASTGSAANYYAVGQLQANVTYDEHNNDVIEYTDKLGHTVCKKVYAETINSVKQYACTYYVYDSYGNLVVVIPPEAIKSALAAFTQN